MYRGLQEPAPIFLKNAQGEICKHQVGILFEQPVKLSRVIKNQKSSRRASGIFWRFSVEPEIKIQNLAWSFQTWGELTGQRFQIL